MLVYKIHNRLLSLNDKWEYNFNDKQLHFLVVGVVGMALVLAIYPVFRWLAKHHHEMVITWIYVFTVLVVLTFAIEIGQGYSGTGSMEFADITSGLGGFMLMFLVFCIIRAVFHGIIKRIKSIRQKHNSNK